MKAILAFGRFGEVKSERIEIPTVKLAAQLAADIYVVNIGANDDVRKAMKRHFTVSRDNPRATAEDPMKIIWVSVTAIL